MSNNNPNKLTSGKRTVSEYLLDGPIPAESLAFLDLVEPYLEMGIADGEYDIQFMLETLYSEGAPKWWKRSVAEFEQEFQEVFDKWMADLNQEIATNRETFFDAAENVFKAGNLASLPENSTHEQHETFLEQGKKSLMQRYALELLLSMWVNEMGL